MNNKLVGMISPMHYQVGKLNFFELQLFCAIFRSMAGYVFRERNRYERSGAWKFVVKQSLFDFPFFIRGELVEHYSDDCTKFILPVVIQMVF